jgi:hypothetical protein
MLLFAAISQAQVVQPLPVSEEVVQGHYVTSIPSGVWFMLQPTPLDSCAYQVGTGVANTLPAGIWDATENAFFDIGRMNRPMVSMKTRQVYAGYSPDIQKKIEGYAIIFLDSVAVMLGHPLAYMIVSTDSDGVMTIHVAVGWTRKNGGTLEEAVIRSVKQAGKQVLAEKSRALLEEADEL